MSSCHFLTEQTTPLATTLDKIHQSLRVDDDGGGGVGSGRHRRSGHRSHNVHGRDGEAGIGISYGAIGSRRREHPHGDNERGQSGCSMRVGGEK